jgi:hypothetical protein
MPIPADHSVVWGQFDSNGIRVALISMDTSMSMALIQHSLVRM